MDMEAIADSVKYDKLVLEAIKKIGNKYANWTRDYLLNVYSDPQLHSLYRRMRDTNKLDDKLSKPKVHRLKAKFPSMIVLKFLDDLFAPKYGDDWLEDKDKFNKVCKKEELIKPWLVR